MYSSLHVTYSNIAAEIAHLAKAPRFLQVVIHPSHEQFLRSKSHQFLQGFALAKQSGQFCVRCQIHSAEEAELGERRGRGSREGQHENREEEAWHLLFSNEHMYACICHEGISCYRITGVLIYELSHLTYYNKHYTCDYCDIYSYTHCL